MSRGSPLGPTMADFYMAELESKLLNDDKISNPIMYMRYVDDTICIFKNRGHIHHFVRRLKTNSVLDFTHEIMNGDHFNFLDVNLKLRDDGSFDTSVFIKPTDKGLYANYNSHIPMQYKKSVINSLVNRAIKTSSTPESRRQELARITQVLVNNGYHQSEIDKIIKSKIQQKLNSQASVPNTATSDDINVYVELHTVSNFRHDSKSLKNIIKRHVQPTDDAKNVKITTFYRPLKLSSKFTTRTPAETAEKSCLVYQFMCPEPSCHEVAYYGYTNQRLKTRVKQHRYKDSSICKHYMDCHEKLPPKFDEFVKSFQILFSCNDILSIKIAEAILIKNNKPIINVKYNELYDFFDFVLGGGETHPPVVRSVCFAATI